MLAGALVALGAQVAAGQDHGVVTLCCVGAVAAVLAAHIVLHPRARVHSVLFAPVFSSVLAIPALALIAAWTALQVALAIK
jgi:membrane associated rhomboid family serine protease